MFFFYSTKYLEPLGAYTYMYMSTPIEKALGPCWFNLQVHRKFGCKDGTDQNIGQY